MEAVRLRVLDLALHDRELPRQRDMKALKREIAQFKDRHGGRDFGLSLREPGSAALNP